MGKTSVSTKDIGSKDFQGQVDRYREETRLAKIVFFLIIFILTGLVALGLVLLFPKTPALLTSAIFVVFQAIVLMLAYQGGFRLLDMFCKTTDAFPGDPYQFSKAKER